MLGLNSTIPRKMFRAFKGQFKGDGGDDDSVPFAMVAGAGIMDIRCHKTPVNFTNYPLISGNFSDENEGPPPNLMLSAPSDDVLSTFLGAFGGYTFPHSVSNRKVSGLYITSFRMGPMEQASVSPRNLRDCQPYAKFPGMFGDLNPSPGKQLANASGSTFQGRVNFQTYREVKCDYKKAKLLVRDLGILVTAFENATDKAFWDQIDMTIGSITAREAYGGCIDIAIDFALTGPRNRTVMSGRDCFFNPGTAEYMQSPCCNDTLRFTQCCANERINITVIDVVSFNESTIQQRCSHAKEIKMLLGNFLVKKKEADAIVSPAMSRIFDESFAFVHDCYQAMYNTKCKTNAQCKYTDKCNAQNSRCEYDYIKDGVRPIARCLIDNMPDTISPLFKKGINTFSTDPAVVKQAMFDYFLKHFVHMDCMGETAVSYDNRGRETRNCQAHSKATKDEDGNVQWTDVAGNETCCKLDKRCNFEPWQYDTETKCINNTKNVLFGHDYFCGMCWGTQCQESSQPPLCSVFGNYHSQSLCESAGLTWIVRWGWGSCYKVPANNYSQCIGSNYIHQKCSAASYSGDNYCWLGECYAETYTQAQCEAIQYNSMNATWDSNYGGACLFHHYWTYSGGNYQNMCGTGALSGFTMFSGVYFQQPRFNTNATCSEGYCDVEGEPEMPAAECTSTVRCTQGCIYCASDAYLRNSLSNSFVCYNSTATSEEQCDYKWDSSNSLCYAQDANTSYCSSLGLITASCGDATTATTCKAARSSNSGWGNFLECYWSTQAPCRSASDCNAAGTCDDWEFEQWNVNSNGNYEPILGACLMKNKYLIDTNGYQTCEYSQTAEGQSNRNYQGPYYQWSRIGCIISGYNRTQCDNVGETWTDRALNASACAAHGSNCHSRYEGFNGMNAAECTKCEGTMHQTYHWNGGVVTNGSMVQMKWQQRAWSPTNYWGTVLNHRALGDLIGRSIGQYLALQQKVIINKKYRMIARLLVKIACDCTQRENTTMCFPGTAEKITLDSCEVMFEDNSCGALKNITLIGNSSKIETYETPASSASTIDASNSSSKKLLINDDSVVWIEMRKSKRTAATNEWAVIKNTHGVLVGQLVGNGKGFAVTGGIVLPTQFCTDISTSITVYTSNYPTYDYAKGSGSSDNPGAPLGLTVTKTENQLCADVNSTGTYYPIARMTEYNIACDTSCGNGNCDGSTLTCACLDSAAYGYWTTDSKGSCTACKADFYGDSCKTQCTEASCNYHGLCAVDGSCACTNDKTNGSWTGSKCTACGSNYYGSDCKTECTAGICNDHGTCNQYTGACECTADATNGFWDGATCQVCASGYNGAACKNAATSCSGVTCSGHGTCNSTTFQCECHSDTTNGYWAGGDCDTCQNDATNGHWAGSSCTACSNDAVKGHWNTSTSCKTCSGNFYGANCLSCVSSASAGHWTGSNCDICADSAAEGHWQPAGSCNQCINTNANGHWAMPECKTCVSSAQDGYFAGSNCTACATNYFPANGCTVQCLASVKCNGKGTCKSDGTCQCNSGWGGADCDTAQANGSASHFISFFTVVVVALLSIVQFLF